MRQRVLAGQLSAQPAPLRAALNPALTLSSSPSERQTCLEPTVWPGPQHSPTCHSGPMAPPPPVPFTLSPYPALYAHPCTTLCQAPLLHAVLSWHLAWQRELDSSVPCCSPKLLLTRWPCAQSPTSLGSAPQPLSALPSPLSQHLGPGSHLGLSPKPSAASPPAGRDLDSKQPALNYGSPASPSLFP